MNTAALNHLWTYIQSLSLTKNNQKWLADRLYEASRESVSEKVKEKQAALDQMYGILSEEDADAFESAVRECRETPYQREIASMDD